MVFQGPLVQLSIVHEHSPTYNRCLWNQLILRIGDHCHTTLFGHTLHWANPMNIWNRVHHPRIKPLNNVLFYHLSHQRIQPPMVLYTWSTIFLKLDSEGANTRRYSNDVSYGPPNCLFDPYQDFHYFLHLFIVKISSQNSWQCISSTHKNKPQVPKQLFQLKRKRFLIWWLWWRTWSIFVSPQNLAIKTRDNCVGVACHGRGQEPKRPKKLVKENIFSSQANLAR